MSNGSQNTLGEAEKGAFNVGVNGPDMRADGRNHVCDVFIGPSVDILNRKFMGGAAMEIISRQVTFRLHAPKASAVFLAGNFNGWNTRAFALKKAEKGEWQITINLLPGIYEYKFVVDGQWRSDPACEGVFNSFVHVQ